MKWYLFFLLSFTSALFAMNDDNPLFLQIKRNPKNLNELEVRKITPDTHASICALMCLSKPAFPGVYMRIKPDAIELFQKSELLRIFRQVEPNRSGHLTFLQIFDKNKKPRLT